MIERCNQVKLALTAGFPVLLSVVVDDYWDMCSNSNPIPEPAMETARGSHYVCVVGYWAVGGQHTERYLVCNSWGKYWGDYGFGWMSRDRMVHATTDDLAVLESMEIPNT
jgi:C1A family cysteine protease